MTTEFAETGCKQPSVPATVSRSAMPCQRQDSGQRAIGLFAGGADRAPHHYLLEAFRRRIDEVLDSRDLPILATDQADELALPPVRVEAAWHPRRLASPPMIGAWRPQLSRPRAQPGA